MKRLTTFFAFIFLLFQNGCSLPKSDWVVHPGTWPRSTPLAVRGRQIAIFMDGTQNAPNDRTNVRRLYEMTTSRHAPDMLTFYDPGVGTGDSAIYAGFGAVMGLGFQQNLRDALTFLVNNYRAGDEISIFGFSRGAFCAGVLATIVSRAGFPVLSEVRGENQDARLRRAEAAVSQFYAEIHSAETAASRRGDIAVRGLKDPPEERARLWRSAYWDYMNREAPEFTPKGRHAPGIAVLGLWEPVDALVHTIKGIGKIGFSVSDISEFARHRGHELHPYALGPQIRECYLAIALDEQRQPFYLELPDYAEGQPRQYEFVWFTGDHSDLGGGHDNKDLAGVSMNWMLSRVGPRLLGPGGERARVYEDFRAPRHDLSINKLYGIGNYRVRGEILGSEARIDKPRDPKWFMPQEAPYLVPVRYAGWRMCIHQTVLDRMALGYDEFLPPAGDTPVDLAQGAWPASGRFMSRNPAGTYFPRPFREGLAATPASPDAWSKTHWNSAMIKAKYPICPRD